MRSSFPILVILFIVVLAGCNAFPTSDSGSTDETVSQSEPEYPPGIEGFETESEEVRVNISKIAEVHVDALENRDYVYKESGNTDRTVVVKDGFFAQRHKTQETETVWWSDGKRVVIRNGDEYLTRMARVNETREFSRHSASLFERHLSASESEITVSRASNSKVWLTSTSPPPGIGTDGRYRAIALVDSDGVINELYIEYRQNDETEEVSFEYKFESNGNSSKEFVESNAEEIDKFSFGFSNEGIDRPDWYSEAVSSDFTPEKIEKVVGHGVGVEDIDLSFSGVPVGRSSRWIGEANYLGLRNRSYEYYEDFERIANGTTLTSEWERSVMVSEDEVYETLEQRIRQGSDKRRYESWSNGTIQVLRYGGRTQVRDRRRPIEATRELSETVSNRLENPSFFGPIKKGGEIIYIVVSTSTSEQNFNNYVGIAEINRSGFVQKMEIEYGSIGIEGKTEYHSEYLFELSLKEDINIEKPDWLKEIISD